MIYKSQEEIDSLSSNGVLLVLMGENISNTTEIYAEPERNTIYIQGKSFQGKNYNDLDLATDKLLLILFHHLK